MEETRKLRQSIRLQNILKTSTALFQNVGWFSTKPCHTLGQAQTGYVMFVLWQGMF